MDYASLLVHIDLGDSNEAKLRIAGQMAARFHAHVIGAAASDPTPPAYADGMVASALIAQDRRNIESEMAVAEQAFKAEMRGHVVECEWRQGLERPVTFVARQARAADLLITGLRGYQALDDSRHALDPSELIVQAGRPVLLVPPPVQSLSARRIVVGWKDTREARRAIWDALPLLKTAEQVVVATVRELDDEDAGKGAEDVVRWLMLHGAPAVSRTFKADGNAAQSLATVASDELADLLVAGAYGHSRLGEWIWGGVSQTLLTSSRICCLMAH